MGLRATYATDEANDLGLRLLATKSLPERPLLPQQMHRILRNRYFIGVVTYGGVDYPRRPRAAHRRRYLGHRLTSNKPSPTTGALCSSLRTGIEELKSVIEADFEGRHAEGEQEVARQRKRLARLEHERTKAKTAYYDDALTLDEFKLEQARIGHEAKADEATIAHWTIEIEVMRRALDEALSLLVDPYRLYTETPEGINLMLMQAICEKVWILDTSVAG